MTEQIGRFAERLVQLESRLTRVEERQNDSMKYTHEVAKDLKTHRNMVLEAQQRTRDAIELLRIENAKQSQRHIERDRVRGIIQTISISVLAAFLSVVANLIIK